MKDSYMKRLETAIYERLVEANGEAWKNWKDDATAEITMKCGDNVSITFCKVFSSSLELLHTRRYSVSINGWCKKQCDSLDELVSYISSKYRR